MKNPFSAEAFEPQKLKRFPRDLSHQKLFTTEFGKGMPVLCQEVVMGDTIKIEDVQLDIQGMPTYFPLLSPLHVSVSYFYCRNRCVDDSFEDFIFNNKTIDKPWLRMTAERAKVMISTGSLGDMFGLPSTVGSDTSVSKSWLFVDKVLTLNIAPSYKASPSDFISWCKDQLIAVRTINSSLLIDFPSTVPSASGTFINHKYYTGQIVLTNPIKSVPSSTLVSFLSNVLQSQTSFLNVSTIAVVQNGVIYPQFFDVSISFDGYNIVFGSNSSLLSLLNSIDLDNNEVRLMLCYFSAGTSSSAETPTCQLAFNKSGSYYSFKYLGDSRLIISSPSVPQLFPTSDVTDSTDDANISDNIYVGNNPVRKLEAWAFRHYMMIGNYYYRNDRNNPFVLNGEPQYNNFIYTKSAGPDDNVYDFFYRNWELDRFTSCVQSPQFGDAPLVGLTYNPRKDSAVLTFSATDEEGVTKSYDVRVGIDDDTKLANIADFSKDIPSATLRHVTDMIAYGISINDIRVTNAYQRFKERVFLRGPRYRNQIKSHIGISVDYPDIDIPQYIGGFAGNINSIRNENTAASAYANLGDFNGGLFGNFKLSSPITVRVPENGYIMGIMTITPIPSYPQAVTNKALIKRSPFDYYLPEFGKIGFVPVHYDEVMPLQNGVGQSPNDVFGYQRAHYDYLQNLDEVHGDFRTTLRNFVCTRTFAERPELGADFTTVHPEELNQVFISQNIADKYGSNSKFLCRISYRMKRLGLMLDSMPALE